MRLNLIPLHPSTAPQISLYHVVTLCNFSMQTGLLSQNSLSQHTKTAVNRTVAAFVLNCLAGLYGSTGVCSLNNKLYLVGLGCCQIILSLTSIRRECIWVISTIQQSRVWVPLSLLPGFVSLSLQVQILGYVCKLPAGLPLASWYSYQCYVQFELVVFSCLLSPTSLLVVLYCKHYQG